MSLEQGWEEGRPPQPRFALCNLRDTRAGPSPSVVLHSSYRKLRTFLPTKSTLQILQASPLAPSLGSSENSIMDGDPTAPFSPPFYDGPMTFDDGFDVPLDDWALNDW